MNSILKSKYLIAISVCIFVSNYHAQDLFDLIEKEQTDKAINLITQKPDLANFINSDKDSPLHYAAYFGNLEITNLLISNGAKVNVQNDFEHTPLHYAVRNEFFEIAETLLKAGADPNIKNYWGDTPVFYPVSAGNKKLIELLIKNDADLNKKNALGDSPLADVVNSENIEMAEYLISMGSDLESLDKGGQSILFRAMLKDNIEMVEKLLKMGSKLNSLDNAGLSLLHKMVIYGRHNMASYLIEHGLEVALEDNAGRTPLYYAAKYGHRNIFDLLIQKGAAVPNDIEYNFEFSTDLQKNLNKNEAFIWYLGISGWAVKTQNHLLIFDYVEWENAPDKRLLANGHIDTEEIKDLDVIVFTTHSHSDHYDPVILEWEKDVKSINYVFSWEEESISKHICLTDSNAAVEINNVSIHTINHSTDVPEVAFLVKADDLVIYNSGDYRGDYEKDLDYFSNIYGRTDIAFVLASGGKPDVSKRAVELLSPKVIFPTHALDGYEFLYNNFEDFVGSSYSQNLFCQKNKGDKFFFDGNTIKQ